MLYMNFLFYVKKNLLGKLVINFPKSIEPKIFAMSFARKHAERYGISACSIFRNGYEFWFLKIFLIILARSVLKSANDYNNFK